MQPSRSVVVASAAAAFWSPRAAAACVLRQAHGAAARRCQSGSRQQRRDNDAQNKTHDVSPFSVFTLQGPAGRGPFQHTSAKGHEYRHYVFAEAGYECTHRLTNAPTCSSASPPVLELRIPHRPGMDHVRPDLRASR